MYFLMYPNRVSANTFFHVKRGNIFNEILSALQFSTSFAIRRLICAFLYHYFETSSLMTLINGSFNGSNKNIREHETVCDVEKSRSTELFYNQAIRETAHGYLKLCLSAQSCDCFVKKKRERERPLSDPTKTFETNNQNKFRLKNGRKRRKKRKIKDSRGASNRLIVSPPLN